MERKELGIRGGKLESCTQIRKKGHSHHDDRGDMEILLYRFKFWKVLFLKTSSSSPSDTASAQNGTGITGLEHRGMVLKVLSFQCLSFLILMHHFDVPI